MATPRRKSKPTRGRKSSRNNKKTLKLPTARREPVKNVWQYAYLITGEKKIGKTSFAIEGCEEFVLQFDKPQLSVNIREEMIESWKQSIEYIKLMEQAAKDGDFPYNRIVIDGVGEWYTMCQTEACSHFDVEHPSDVGFAKCWHRIRDNFLEAVNRLLRLQTTAECGIIFIAHAEWQEKSTRGGPKIEKLVPDLGGKCEKIINGKVDGWFMYDYSGKDRVMVIRGDEACAAGHRIDFGFITKDGRKIEDINMGSSAEEAMQNFIDGFNGELEYASSKEQLEATSPKRKTTRAKRTLSRTRKTK